MQAGNALCIRRVAYTKSVLNCVTDIDSQSSGYKSSAVLECIGKKWSIPLINASELSDFQ